MGILDIVLLLCFIPAIITGISKGLILQVLELIALIVGSWAGFVYSEAVGLWLSSFIQIDESILKVVSFLLVLIAVALVLGLVGKIITRILKKIALGGLNAILGIIFGIFKTMLILGLLISLFESLVSSLEFLKPESLYTLEQAPVYNFIKDTTQGIFPVLKSLIANV